MVIGLLFPHSPTIFKKFFSQMHNFSRKNLTALILVTDLQSEDSVKGLKVGQFFPIFGFLYFGDSHNEDCISWRIARRNRGFRRNC